MALRLQGAIDCDVHPSVPGVRALFPYLDDYWRDMIELRGMTESEARGRIANQVGDEARRRLADVVIDTSRTRADTIAQVDALWARLTRRPA